MALATSGCLILRYCRVSRSVSSSGAMSPAALSALRSRMTGGNRGAASAAACGGAGSLGSGACGRWLCADACASPAECCSRNFWIAFSTTLISEAPEDTRRVEIQEQDGDRGHEQPGGEHGIAASAPAPLHAV